MYKLLIAYALSVMTFSCQGAQEQHPKALSDQQQKTLARISKSFAQAEERLKAIEKSYDNRVLDYLMQPLPQLSIASPTTNPASSLSPYSSSSTHSFWSESTAEDIKTLHEQVAEINAAAGAQRFVAHRLQAPNPIRVISSQALSAH